MEEGIDSPTLQERLLKELLHKIGMRKHNQLIGYLLMALQALMLVMAYTGTSSAPQLFKQAGHFHPLFLHLPIAFIVLLLPIALFSKKENHSINFLLPIFLHYTAILATFTAILGLLAASSNEYDASTIFNHKWLSIGTALFCHGLIYVHQYFASNRKIWISSVACTTLFMITGSHFGGSLTHGENYLSFENNQKEQSSFKPLTDSTHVYNDVINTVLINKCLECHNDKKSKGGLNLVSYASFQKGGKSGVAWVSGDPDKSLFIQRMLLAMDDNKHMPPKGKAQLSGDEIFLFKQWVIRKADRTLTYHSLEINDTLRTILERIVSSNSVKKEIKLYDFEKASDSKIKELNSPFRRILPIDVNSPALSVKFYLKEKFDIQLLEECKSISKQIIEINLSNMPVDDKVFPLLTSFEHLEKLNLNGTLISGKSIEVLKSIKTLEQISLANTAIEGINTEKLSGIPSLKYVYLWNSKTTVGDIQNLQKKYPTIKWDSGYIPDDKELLKLTPPAPVNIDKMILDPGETIALRHPLPGAQIRYTLDGTKPDSVNGSLYTKPFPITGLTKLNAVGASPGWLTSEPSAYMYFLKGIKIDSVSLINQPADKYRAKGALALMDLNKGTVGNLNLNWIGFRENTMKAAFHFSEDKPISKIILSLADNTGAYVFPPEKIIIKAGPDKDHTKIIGSLQPQQPTEQRNASLIPYTIDFQPAAYRYIEVEAINVQRLPKWHPGKKEKGWVFADEIFFY